jgi:mannose-6-phosphate isomerase
MELLTNPIRTYAWGSTSVIAGVQGRQTPSVQPEAELWMGGHPSAPSRLFRGGA